MLLREKQTDRETVFILRKEIMGEVVGDTLYGVSYESDRLMIYQILKIDSVLVINQIPKNFKFVLIP